MAIDINKRKKIICPVTFVKNDLCISEDLNTIFLTPYDTKRIQQNFANETLDISIREPMFSNYNCSETENIYKKYPFEFTNYAGEFNLQSKYSTSTVIADYIKMNTLDLINSTLLIFFDTLFDKEITSKYLSLDKNFMSKNRCKDQSFKGYIINEIISFININENFAKAINNALDRTREIYPILEGSSIFDINNNSTNIEDKVFILIESLMQGIFSNIVVAYNALISEFIMNIVTLAPYYCGDSYSTGFLLYNYFMLKAYGEECMVSVDKYITIDTVQRYSVITTMIREGLDNCLFMLREGFMQISHTAGMMASNLSSFSKQDILDREFKIVDKSNLEDNNI